MPDFLRIGIVKENDSGVGSRGWRIVRRGRVVLRWYGGVDVVQGRVTRFVWAAGWPREVDPIRCRTEQEARIVVKRYIAEKRRVATGRLDGSYQPLPPRRRITDR